MPNIVWLPSQIAKLTDLEGSLVQGTLQETSWVRYRNAPVDGHLKDVVEEAGGLLPAPAQSGVFDFEEWNYFVPTPAFFELRAKRIREALDAVEAILAGGQPSGKVTSTRYTQGLPSVDPSALRAPDGHLARFIAPVPAHAPGA